MRTGEMLRFFYLQAGLTLLVLVTAGIFLAAAYFEPELLGSQAGGRRADAILIFCGVPAIVLAALFAAFLQPRAVMAAYEGYALCRFGHPQSTRALGESAGRAYARVKGVYWWVILLRLVTGAAFGAAGLALSRWLGARFPLDRWGATAVWTLCVVLFWQSRLPVLLALPAAVHEQVSGIQALRRGFLIYRRARYRAVEAAFRTLLAVFLPLTGVLVLSARIAAGNVLVQYALAAFFSALLYPPLRLLLAAFDTAVYAEAVRGQTAVKRWTYSASRLRMPHDRRKGR